MNFIDYFMDIALPKGKNRILLEAEGGFGKTTSLKYLAQKLLDSYEIVPIYVDCKDLSSYSVEEVIVHEYCGDDASCENFDKILKSAKNIKFVFMFDSFNEVKEKTCDKVLDFCGRYNGNQYSHIYIIIASRSVIEVHRTILKDNGYQSLKLQPLDANRVKTTVSEYLTTPSESLITILCNPMMLSVFLKAENKDAFSGVRTQAGLLEVYFEGQRRKIAIQKKYMLKEKNTFELLICIALPLFFYENEGKYSFQIDVIFDFIDNLDQKCKESVFKTEYRKICLQNDIDLSPALFKEFTTDFLNVFEENDDWIAHQIYADYFASKWYQKAIEAWINTPSAVPQFVFCEYNHMQDYTINLVSGGIARFLLEAVDFNKVFDAIRSEKPPFEAIVNAWILNLLSANQSLLEKLDLSNLDLTQFDFHCITLNHVNLTNAVLNKKSFEPYINDSDYEVMDFSVLWSKGDIAVVSFAVFPYWKGVQVKTHFAGINIITGRILFHFSCEESLSLVNEKNNELLSFTKHKTSDCLCLSVLNLYTGQVKYQKLYDTVPYDEFYSEDGLLNAYIEYMEQCIVIETHLEHSKKAIVLNSEYHFITCCIGDADDELVFGEGKFCYQPADNHILSFDEMVEISEKPLHFSDVYDDLSILTQFDSYYQTKKNYIYFPVYALNEHISLLYVKLENIFVIIENKKRVLSIVDDFKTPFAVPDIYGYEDDSGENGIYIETVFSDYDIDLNHRRVIDSSNNPNGKYLVGSINEEYYYGYAFEGYASDKLTNTYQFYKNEVFAFSIDEEKLWSACVQFGAAKTDDSFYSGKIIREINGIFYAVCKFDFGLLLFRFEIDYDKRNIINFFSYDVSCLQNIHYMYCDIIITGNKDFVLFYDLSQLFIYNLNEGKCETYIYKNAFFYKNYLTHIIKGKWVILVFSSGFVFFDKDNATNFIEIDSPLGTINNACLIEGKIYCIVNRNELYRISIHFEENPITFKEVEKVTVLLDDIRFSYVTFDGVRFFDENKEDTNYAGCLEWYNEK